MAITVSNPPFSAAVFQMVYGAQPQLVGSSPSFYDFVASATTGSLPADVTATRASSASYNSNSSGTLASAAVDVPRFAYQLTGSTWAPGGILVEDAATNFLSYSEEFDNAVWGKTQCSVSANAIAAPDGTTTADALVENSAAATVHNVNRVQSYTSGTGYIASVYAKAGTRGWIYIYLDPARFGGTGYTYFDISTGALGTVQAGVTAFINLEANGFYRCTVMAAATSTGGAVLAIGLANGNNGASYTGDGVSQAYIWGASLLTANRVISSYIKTTSSAVARSADVVLVTNAHALADQCWIVKGRTPSKISGGGVNVAFQVDDGTANNRRTLRYGTDGKLHVIATVGGVDQCDLDLGAVANNTDFAVAIRWANNNFAASLNGGAIVTDTSGTNPLGLTTARVGCGSTGNYWSSTIATIQTLPTASDTELPLLAA